MTGARSGPPAAAEGAPDQAPGTRGPAAHPDIVRHAAAAFNARVTHVVRKNRPEA